MDYRVEKRIGVRATSERIWSLIADLSGWDHWNPFETKVSGTIAYGGTAILTETLPDLGSRGVTYALAEWQPYAQLVWQEKRGWQFSVTRYYEIEELEPGSCIVSNGYIFSGLRGEGYQVKHRHTLKTACEQINEALKQAAEERAEA